MDKDANTKLHFSPKNRFLVFQTTQTFVPTHLSQMAQTDFFMSHFGRSMYSS